MDKLLNKRQILKFIAKKYTALYDQPTSLTPSQNNLVDVYTHIFVTYCYQGPRKNREIYSFKSDLLNGFLTKPSEIIDNVLGADVTDQLLDTGSRHDWDEALKNAWLKASKLNNHPVDIPDRVTYLVKKLVSLLQKDIEHANLKHLKLNRWSKAGTEMTPAELSTFNKLDDVVNFTRTDYTAMRFLTGKNIGKQPNKIYGMLTYRVLTKPSLLKWLKDHLAGLRADVLSD